MSPRPIVYGLDIETDTTANCIDPQVASIRAVALSSDVCDEVFTGDEADLLAELDDRIATLPRGVIATWNGAAFDLPFLADRAAVCGVAIGLRLRHDPRLGLRRAPLPGHPGAYRGAWYDHAHIDAFRLYRADSEAAPRVPGSLRSLARFVGRQVVEVERDRVVELEREALHAYAPGDARLARVLTERRWQAARTCIDRRVHDTGPWVPPWALVDDEALPEVEVEVELAIDLRAGVEVELVDELAPVAGADLDVEGDIEVEVEGLEPVPVGAERPPCVVFDQEADLELVAGEGPHRADVA